MNQGTAASLLARKVGRARAGDGGEHSPWAQAWHVVVPRVADEALGVEAGLLKARQRRQDLGAVLEAAGETGLFLRLAGPGAGAGVAHLDHGLLAALLEAQTVGRVLPAPAPERAGTKTDAAIVAPLVARLFSATASEAAERAGPEPPWAGFAVQGRFADRRAVELQLDAGQMEVARIELDLGGGLKTGVLSIAVRPGDRQPAPAAAAAADRAGFTESVMDAGARLAVVLDRPRVAIGWLRDLEPGARLAIPRTRLEEARIETTGGALLARARLGQAAGQRAVRLTRCGAAPSGRPVGGGATGMAGGGMPAGVAGAEASGPADLPGMPDLPDLPGLPAGGPELPDLPDFPDLPDLPDLPGLPEAG